MGKRPARVVGTARFPTKARSPTRPGVFLPVLHAERTAVEHGMVFLNVVFP